MHSTDAFDGSTHHAISVDHVLSYQAVSAHEDRRHLPLFLEVVDLLSFLSFLSFLSWITRRRDDVHLRPNALLLVLAFVLAWSRIVGGERWATFAKETRNTSHALTGLVYSVRCTMYSVHCTVYSVQRRPHDVVYLLCVVVVVVCFLFCRVSRRFAGGGMTMRRPLALSLIFMVVFSPCRFLVLSPCRFLAYRLQKGTSVKEI